MSPWSKSVSSLSLLNPIENYLQLVNLLEDAILVIKKEKAEESKKNEQSGQLYNILISYIQKIKLQSSVDRNLLQASSLSKKISLDQLFSHSKLQSELRPQNIVRFIEKALKSQRSIVNMEKDQLDPFKQLEYEFAERFYTTQIKYYIGLHYANERNYQEAYLILSRVSSDIESTIEFAQKNNLQSQKVKRDLSEMESDLLKGLSYLLCKCHAKILMTEHDAFSKVTAEMGDIKMEGAKTVKFENLYDLMFNGIAEPKSNQTKKLLINGSRLDFLE